MEVIVMETEVTRKGDWIQTYSGRCIYPLDPRPEDIDIIDIAHALSNQCRFSGHCKKFYSIAQHSVLVASMCSAENMLWGLCHDMSEYALVDLPRPLKRSQGFEAYLEAEKNFMKLICQVFSLPEDMPVEVKIADDRMLVTEKLSLLGKSPKPWSDNYEPYNIKIIPWNPEKAEKEFLSMFRLITENI